ncbi:MAG: PDZ domain-containing protein, partial [Anaerolineae bacterium]|nr:PDZ domain-containing protein [Phycisphaerae bacterium]
MSQLMLIALVIALVICMPAIAQNNDDESLAGIGMAFDRSPERYVRVGGVLPDGPAKRAGIAAGDLIAAIDGADVRTLSDDQIPQKIRGQKDTEVTLVVFTPGQQDWREVKVRRAMIPPRGQQQQAVPPPPPQRQQPQQPRQAAAPQTTGVQKFSLMTVKDPGVNDIVALNVMVPQGWQMQGRVIWMPEYSVASNLQLVVSDPKSGFSIQWLPTQSFTFVPNPPVAMQPGTNYMGRIFAQPIGDPAQFVQWFYAQTLPHLRNAKFVAGEDFANQAKYYQAQMTTQ